jgi:uncharacterized protein YcsI (UPF0317 family)
MKTVKHASMTFDGRADEAEPMSDVLAASSALSAQSVRRRIRSGEMTGQTAGLARGKVQGNLAILPADWAEDFLVFCRRNPKPCPLLAVGSPGQPELPALGADIDLRTDVPRYRVFENGREIAAPNDILDYWRGDLVAFVLGCSFSFEWALREAGLRLRHIDEGTTVPMYRTNIALAPSDRFRGTMVVSMRPFSAADAIRAIEITAHFPRAHGAPVHFGRPELIGVGDIARPDFGDPVALAADEVPVFWACGVTPQAVVEAARPPLFISHFPGCMLITDVDNTTLAAPGPAA